MWLVPQYWSTMLDKIVRGECKINWCFLIQRTVLSILPESRSIWWMVFLGWPSHHDHCRVVGPSNISILKTISTVSWSSYIYLMFSVVTQFFCDSQNQLRMIERSSFTHWQAPQKTACVHQSWRITPRGSRMPKACPENSTKSEHGGLKAQRKRWINTEICFLD